MKKIKVGIIGGTGYTAGELLRILIPHPNVEIVGVSSSSKSDIPVYETHKNLKGFTNLLFSDISAVELSENADLLFFAIPNGNAKLQIPELVKHNKSIKIIDLSGDFRIKNLDVYKEYYGDAPNQEVLEKFVYGLSEFNRDDIKNAQYIANPGCFATGINFALMPLAKEGLLNGVVSVTGNTGSSGSGAKPKAGTHHPRRNGNFWSYKMLEHQHEPEVLQCMYGDSKPDCDFSFVPHSLPIVRGIFITATVRLSNNDFNQVSEIYDNCYGGEYFVRKVDGSPELKSVVGTNMVEYSLFMKNNVLVVMTATDNLVKGAAGQAVQNMNLMFGFEENAGLNAPCIYP